MLSWCCCRYICVCVCFKDYNLITGKSMTLHKVLLCWTNKMHCTSRNDRVETTDGPNNECYTSASCSQFWKLPSSNEHHCSSIPGLWVHYLGIKGKKSDYQAHSTTFFPTSEGENDKRESIEKRLGERFEPLQTPKTRSAAPTQVV